MKSESVHNVIQSVAGTATAAFLGWALLTMIQNKEVNIEQNTKQDYIGEELVDVTINQSEQKNKLHDIELSVNQIKQEKVEEKRLRKLECEQRNLYWQDHQTPCE